MSDVMRLNTMTPGKGSKRARLRVGRGASAGQGKTSGRGVKGQRARKGGYHKVGFEGGQMPLQRRLPKRGFLAVTIEKATAMHVFNAEYPIPSHALHDGAAVERALKELQK